MRFLKDYKGYKISQDSSKFLILKNGRILDSSESLEDAINYIESLPFHDLSSKKSLKYCIRVKKSDDSPWLYYCNNHRFRPESEITSKNILLYNSPNEARQFLKLKRFSVYLLKDVIISKY